MTVVDPVTRKLLIPLPSIIETRAQHRSTLPSLCQLFLDGRCRQGAVCYQVHAELSMVQQLRSQVDSLPHCCPVHGDKDCLQVIPPYAQTNGLLPPAGDEAADGSMAAARDVVLYVPGSSFFDGNYIPIQYVSYTVGLKRLMAEQMLTKSSAGSRVSLLNPSTGFAEEKVVVDARSMTICRLHANDRCRYAEECKFLHLCKCVTNHDPQLVANQSSNGEESSATAASGYHTWEADGSPLERHNATGSTHPVRQSVFTSVSLKQRQYSASVSLGNNSSVASLPTSMSLSYHAEQMGASLGVGSQNSGAEYRPLLIPQGEPLTPSAAATTTACGVAGAGLAATHHPNTVMVPNNANYMTTYYHGGHPHHHGNSHGGQQNSGGLAGYPSHGSTPLTSRISTGVTDGAGSYGSRHHHSTGMVPLPCPAAAAQPSAMGGPYGESNVSEQLNSPLGEENSGGATSLGGSQSFPAHLNGSSLSASKQIHLDGGSGSRSTPSMPLRWQHNPYASSALESSDVLYSSTAAQSVQSVSLTR